MKALLPSKWGIVISAQQKNYIISAIKQWKIKKSRLKMLYVFKNDSHLNTYLNTLLFPQKQKRQKPCKIKVSDAHQAGDERIELPPKVLETPIIPFDQSPIYRKNLTPVAALNFLGTFILYLQNFTQKASNLTPSNNQRLFQSKLYSLLCMP